MANLFVYDPSKSLKLLMKLIGQGEDSTPAELKGYVKHPQWLKIPHSSKGPLLDDQRPIAT